MTLNKICTLAIGLSTLSMSVHAQVVLDDTLGMSEPLAGPHFAIDASVGQQVGPNLFHSFESFSIKQGQSATFTGPTGIANIISRVTGGRPSSINGLLSSKIPDADMYFLNPAGIMFGQGASLDIQGSLYISTADYLKLGENEYFHATTPSDSLLTVAPPSAFGFLDAPNSITVKNNPLYFPNYEAIQRVMNGDEISTTATFSLVGGDIFIKNGQIITGGNDIHLMSVASAGEAPLDASLWANETFAYYGTINITNIEIELENLVDDLGNLDASGFGGGEIFLRAGQVVLDRGGILADTWQNQAGQGITVYANEALTMKNRSVISTESLDFLTITIEDPSLRGFNPSITGNSGNISISANDITLTNSGIISLSRTAGHAGNITISAKNLIMVEDATIAGTTWGLGNAGDISIEVDTFRLSNSARVAVNAGLDENEKQKNGIGKSGQLTVEAKDAVYINGSEAGLLSNVFNHGQGGTIEITTPTLVITEGGVIEAATLNDGNAGKIFLNIDTLNISGNGSINASTAGNGLGGCIKIRAREINMKENAVIAGSTLGLANAGDISIEVDTFRLSNSAGVSVNAGYLDANEKQKNGIGKSGQLTVEAKDAVYINGSEAGLLSNVFNHGQGGTIEITTPTLVITEGGVIEAATENDGNAGEIFLNVDTLNISGNGSINASTAGNGLGGYIKIQAREIKMKENVVIAGTTFGLGNAGDISIEVDTFSLSGGAIVSVNAGYLDANEKQKNGIGKAGQLTVEAKDAVYISGSKTGFLSNVFNHGQGGTIEITTPILVITQGGGIQAATQHGNGGNILLNVDSLNLNENGFISVETYGTGPAGHVDIQANEVHLTDNSSIKANSYDEGTAGDIKLTLGDKLTMNQGSIQTAANSADGGNITITAENYLFLVDSDISTSVGTGLGSGGNITLRPKFVIQFAIEKESPIIAQAYGGPGGNIDITAIGIYQSPPDSPKTRISASSQFGTDGIVQVSNPDNDAMGDIVIQTTDFLDVSGLLNTPCNQRSAERLSHFAMIHSYGESNSINDLLPSGLMSFEPITLKTPIARKFGKKGHSPLLMGRLTACSPLRLSMSTRVKIPTPSYAEPFNTSKESRVIPSQLF